MNDDDELIGDVLTLEEFNKVKDEKNYRTTAVFDNVFTFMNYTRMHLLSRKNSVTWFDTRRSEMHIAY